MKQPVPTLPHVLPYLVQQIRQRSSTVHCETIICRPRRTVSTYNSAARVATAIQPQHVKSFSWQMLLQRSGMAVNIFYGQIYLPWVSISTVSEKRRHRVTCCLLCWFLCPLHASLRCVFLSLYSLFAFMSVLTPTLYSFGSRRYHGRIYDSTHTILFQWRGTTADRSSSSNNSTQTRTNGQTSGRLRENKKQCR